MKGQDLFGAVVRIVGFVLLIYATLAGLNSSLTATNRLAPGRYVDYNANLYAGLVGVLGVVLLLGADYIVLLAYWRSRNNADAVAPLALTKTQSRVALLATVSTLGMLGSYAFFDSSPNAASYTVALLLVAAVLSGLGLMLSAWLWIKG